MYNVHADKVNCEVREGAMGHVTALLDATGIIVATYYYDAFGNITEQTGNVNNNVTYAGYQYDKETGLYYLMSRMYDPTIARFLQEDTYRGSKNDPLSLNLYTYCHNEPLMYWDYDGHWPTWSGFVSGVKNVGTTIKSAASSAGNAIYNGAVATGNAAVQYGNALTTGVSTIIEDPIGAAKSLVTPQTEQVYTYTFTNQNGSVTMVGNSCSNQSYTIKSSNSGASINYGYGSTGNDVTKIQDKLRALGYFDRSSIGGYYGVTTSAVKRFQQDCNIKADGIVDSVTWNKLFGNNTSISINTESVKPIVPSPEQYTNSEKVINTVLPGSVDRAYKKDNSTYDLINYWTIGLAEDLRNVKETEPLTLDNLKATFILALDTFPGTKIEGQVTKGIEKNVAKKAAETNITKKIEGQMSKRGWTKETINNTVDNFYTTREALNKATGNKATAYYTQDGSYVVKDNITGDVIQISKVGDANWTPDSTIINPYMPNK